MAGRGGARAGAGPESALDLDILHELLWLRAEPRHHTIRIKQSDFCRVLHVSRFTLCRALDSMVAAGRLDCLTTLRGSAVKTYRVVDPEAWDRRPRPSR